MDKATMHADICKNLNDLYQRKNHDYGDSFGKSYQEYGMTMACIRLEDKLNRLKSLCKQEAQVNESLEDTLMDLANYAIMTLVERGLSEEKEAVIRISNAVHDARCIERNCICNRCANDNNSCCSDHKIGHCPRTNCPDFVPEREE